MKRYIIVIVAVVIMLLLISCERTDQTQDTPPPVHTVAPLPATPPVVNDNQIVNDPEPDNQSFGGKILIVTYAQGQNEEYDVAKMNVEKYGEDRIVHKEWHIHYFDEEENIRRLITYASDPDIRAIIINPPVYGTNKAIDILRETREDILVIYIGELMEDLFDHMQRADIILNVDYIESSSAIVRQAEKLGAKTFVHYIYPNHLSNQVHLRRRDLMKEECEKIGIEFVDVTTHDNYNESRQFISDDVPKMISHYGLDTAFVASRCWLQEPLIKSIIELGAIFPQSCCYSIYHGIPLTLSIADSVPTGELDSRGVEIKRLPTPDELITKIRAELTERNMLGRISTWPTSPLATISVAAVEYAIRWLNSEVMMEGIDIDALRELMEDYTGVEVFLTPFEDEKTGNTYENYLMMSMKYITF